MHLDLLYSLALRHFILLSSLFCCIIAILPLLESHRHRRGELIGKLQPKQIYNKAYIKSKNKVLQKDKGTI